MKVRSIDIDNDWNFGKGLSDYLQNNRAIEQNIYTRLNSFIGDCFFDLQAGIDWFNLLGSKEIDALNLAISSVIINTQDVIAILQLSSLLDVERRFTVRYSVQTTYSTISNSFVFSTNEFG